MDVANLPPQVISQITSEVHRYITSNRDKYAGRATALNSEQMQALSPFFPQELLASARVCVLGDERIKAPGFYTIVALMGIRNLPDFSSMAAITFVDVVVSHQPFDDALLFHEMVHVAQYALMGAQEFSRKYVDGFLKGGSYEQIPLEKHAYELEERFKAEPNIAFSVVDEVKRNLGIG